MPQKGWPSSGASRTSCWRSRRTLRNRRSTPSKTFQVTEGSVPSRAGCSGMWRALLFFAVIWVVIGAACVANPWVDCYIDIPERHPQDQVIEEGGHAWIMCGGQRP